MLDSVQVLFNPLYLTRIKSYNFNLRIHLIDQLINPRKSIIRIFYASFTVLVIKIPHPLRPQQLRDKVLFLCVFSLISDIRLKI